MGTTNWTGHCTKAARPVSQYAKDGVYLCTFESAYEAGEMLGISHLRIRSCCRGDKYRKSAGGYVWKYS